MRAEIQYPTYQWLANASIVPSNTTGYSLAQIEGTLTKASGAVPYVRLSLLHLFYMDRPFQRGHTPGDAAIKACLWRRRMYSARSTGTICVAYDMLTLQIGCSGPTRQTITEVWYYSHVLGKPQDGIFKPINQTTTSSCNKTEPLWYYTRSDGSEADQVYQPY